MLRLYLCDDEKDQRKQLRKIVSTQLELEGVDYCIEETSDGDELLGVLDEANHNQAIIFLDIEMKRMNGIETARAVRKMNSRAIIIFVTGYADYVFHGYDVKALNYVLKPYRKEKIIDVLKQALDHMDNNTDSFYVFQTKKSAHKLNVKDIHYFVSDKRKVKVILDDTSYEFYNKLDHIEMELPSCFIRIHQRYLVNLNYVTSIERHNMEIGGESLPISRSKYQDVMVAFAKLMLE